MVLSPGVATYSVANASVSLAPFLVTLTANQDISQPAGILNNPSTNNAQNIDEDERPCELHLFRERESILIASRGPSCRQPISSSKLFTLEAFGSPKQPTLSKKRKRRASGRPFEFATDSTDAEESESSSDDGFIVPDDDEGYKPRRGKKHAKRNVVLSDDEYDDVIIPAAESKAKPKASAAEMNEYEISTKMQVCVYLPRIVVSSTHPVLEDDGRAYRIEEIPPQPEGKIYL